MILQRPHILALPLLVLTFIAGLFPLTLRADTTWSANQLQVQTGRAVTTELGAQAFLTDPEGRLLVVAEADGLRLDDNGIVELNFSERPPYARILLAWRTTAEAGMVHQYWLPATTALSMQLRMGEHPEWKGDAIVLMVGVEARPNEAIGLHALQLRSRTVTDKVLDYLWDWGGYSPWNFVSNNSYAGTSVTSGGLWPTLWFAAFLGVALLMYFAGLLVFSKLSRFSWAAVGVIVLIGWLALDMLWQSRLLLRLQQTHATFSGKNMEEKLQASIDGAMVSFIDRVKEKIDPDTARVFIGSGADYTAMVASYYLAPVNTYWNRHGNYLPSERYLTVGDYILLLPPVPANYDSVAHTLMLQGGSRLPVEELLRTEMGVLVRVTSGKVR